MSRISRPLVKPVAPGKSDTLSPREVLVRLHALGEAHDWAGRDAFVRTYPESFRRAGEDRADQAFLGGESHQTMAELDAWYEAGLARVGRRTT
jgi:hypothetical protein